MKVCKRYQELTQIYHFNPISECELFENMETRYFYSPTYVKKYGLHQYVY